jgi:regulator of protease activity HflC (stomatin/prohibitin superfamily)
MRLFTFTLARVETGRIRRLSLRAQFTLIDSVIAEARAMARDILAEAERAAQDIVARAVKRPTPEPLARCGRTRGREFPGSAGEAAKV